MYICKKYSYINKNGIFMRLCELRQKEIIKMAIEKLKL